MKTILIILLVVVLSNAWASDHIDGVPIPGHHRQIDLSDLYLFATPQHQDRLSVFLHVYPGVSDHGHFSAKVNYKIIINQVTPSIEQKRFGIVHGTAHVIDCHFTEHTSGFWPFGKGEPGTANCTLSHQGQTIQTVSTTIGEISQSEDQRIRFFAGPRSDPFMFGKDQFIAVTERKGFPIPENGHSPNLMENLNVLTLAFELDYDLIGGAGQPYYAVAAESYTQDKEQGSLHLDRIGRPEITNLSHHAYADAQKIKLQYNQYRAFQTELANSENVFRDRLKSNIGTYDTYDNRQDWTDAGLQQVSTLLLDDYLVINSATDCVRAGNGYFALEKALLKGEPLHQCGGRALTDDVMNTLYALYIGGLEGELADYPTGLTTPYADSDKQLSADFPYLAPADGSMVKRLLLTFSYYLGQD